MPRPMAQLMNDPYPSGPDEPEKQPTCCTPRHDSRPEPASQPVAAGPVAISSTTAGMVRLPGGEYLMGDDSGEGYPDDGEGPARRVGINPFWIDACVVSNADFAEFVAATSYVTEAERFGWSFVFAGLLPADFAPTGRRRRPLVAPGGRRGLAPSRGPPVSHRRSRGPSGRARVVARRRGLLPVGGQAAADRGRVGIRGARRARGAAVPLGRPAPARRQHG